MPAKARCQGVKQMSKSDACQCCMSTSDIEIVPVGLGNFTMALCPECREAKYKIAPRPGAYPFKSAVVIWLDCPCHGEQLPRDVENVRCLQATSKKGKRYDRLVVNGKSGKKIYGFTHYDEV